MKIMTGRIEKYRSHVPFLLRIDTLWQFGLLAEAKDYVRTERILEAIFYNNMLRNNFMFFYMAFDRHLIQVFKHSN